MRLRHFRSLMIILISLFILLSVNMVFADLGDTTLKAKTSGPDVKLLQEKLHQLGYLENTEFTDYFGTETETALKEFQKDNNIEADGIAGSQTIEILLAKVKQSELLPDNFTAIKEGDTGEQVSDVQKKLQTLGFFKEDITTTFGAVTKEAVISFQKSMSLAETGIIDKATFVALNKAIDDKKDSTVSASRSALNQRIVETSKKYLGASYVFGAASGKSFDCSGFVMYIMKKFDLNLDHSAAAQFSKGKKIDLKNIQAGDLVFFTTYKKGPSHVGIYIGANKFIHASTSRGVIITDLDEDYYKSRFLGARRYDISLGD